MKDLRPNIFNKTLKITCKYMTNINNIDRNNLSLSYYALAAYEGCIP